jgi:hypothetical protein
MNPLKHRPCQAESQPVCGWGRMEAGRTSAKTANCSGFTESPIGLGEQTVPSSPPGWRRDRGQEERYDFSH